MSKNIRTSKNYTIQAGLGAGGTNVIKLDANEVRITGNLTIDGDQVTQNVTNTTIEDQFLELNRNYSGAGAQDSGIVFNQGTQDDAVFYFDAGSNEFRAGTSPRQIADGSTVAIDIDGGSFTLANIKAASPTLDDHVATKGYVATQVGGIRIAGDDSTTVTVATAENILQFSGGNNITTQASEPDTMTISLGQNLTNIHSITNSSTNADLSLSANSNGSVVIDDVLTFPANRSGEPSATAVTKVFAQTPAGGGTGLYFNNTSVNSGTAGELISKSKATALAIALG